LDRKNQSQQRGQVHFTRRSGLFCGFTVSCGLIADRANRILPNIVIDLHDERYNELVVEVDDPQAVVAWVQSVL
jgi:hypothetical protein